MKPGDVREQNMWERAPRGEVVKVGPHRTKGENGPYNTGGEPWEAREQEM